MLKQIVTYYLLNVNNVFMKSKIHKLSIFIVLLVVFISSINISFASEFSVSSGISVDLHITVIADEFNGNTTNFSILNNSQLASLENMVLENTTFGKINFSETIDLTKVVVNSTVNLDSYIEITNNTIFINTSYFTNLAVPAELSFYQSFFTNPRILQNGNICNPSVCSILSYDSGILIVNTTGLSSSEAVTFTIEETPTESSEETFSGGGGGSCNYNWNCTDLVPFVCPENSMRTRTCVNQGTCIGTFGKPDENQTCTQGTEFSPEIPERLLDIKLELGDDVIYIGGLTGLVGLGNLVDKLTAIITFDNFGDSPLPVSLNYIILNEFGEEVYSETESITILTNAIINKEFDNLDLDFGKYNFILRIEYIGGIVEDFEEEFEVRRGIISGNILYGLVGILVFIILFIIWFILKRRKKEEKKKKR